jgi:hypothetical protein
MATKALRLGAMAAAVAVAVVVPGSAASGTAARVQLAIVPLPKSALGTAARALPIARDSGVVSNADAAGNSVAKVTPAQLSRLGRLTGYLLDYGTSFSGRTGIREIQTEVDRYRSVADARNGLAFWRRDELQGPSLLKRFGLRLSLEKLRLPGVPGPSWSYGGTLAVKGLGSMHGVDAAFQRGEYVLDVSVSAGSASSAERLAPTIARALYGRARVAFAGRLRAGPVTLPRPLRPGPPPHGPKPAGMVLTKSDFGGSATIQRQAYGKPKDSLDRNAVSAYDQTLAPAGSYLDVSQEVVVGAGPLEVKYFAAVLLGEAAYGLGSKSQPTPVQLRGIGDSARAGIVKVAVGGRTGYAAVVVLSRASYLDFVVATRLSTIAKAEVRKLAQSGAKRLDAGFGSPA